MAQITPNNLAFSASGKFVSGGSVTFGFEGVPGDPDVPASLKGVFIDLDRNTPALNPQPLDSDAKYEQSATGIIFGEGIYSVLVRDNQGVQVAYNPAYNPITGDAASFNVGTGPNELPRNSDLSSGAFTTVGTSATIDTGTDFDQIPLNTDIAYPVANVTALRALTGITVGQSFYLEGHTSVGIGGGELLATKVFSSEVDDNGYLFVVDGVVIERVSSSNYVTPLEFGALGDGATDDIIAINRAYQFARNWSPNSSGLLDNRIGLEVKWPARKFIISSPILIDQAGIRTIGSGQYATLIECSSTFIGASALLFQHLAVESVFSSSSVEELTIDTNNKDCEGILYNHAYDHTALINVQVNGVKANRQGIKYQPRAGKTNPISQSAYWRQVIVFKFEAGTNESVYCESLQEFTAIQCKFWNSDNTATQGSGYAVNLQGCRSGSLIDCSFVATSNYGVNIEDNGRATQGIVIDNPNFENVTGGPVRMVSSNSASFPIANVQIRNPRYESPSAGSYLMDGCLRCVVEASFRDVTVTSSSALNTVYTDNLTNISSSSSANTYIAPRSSATSYLDYGSRTRVNTTQSPRTALKNQASDNEYRFSWNFDGATDNGYQVSKVTGGVTAILQQIDGDSLFHRFFDVNSNELMTLRQGNAASETSVSLRFNDGSAQQSRKVEVGATDSGGTGYRLLRVLN